MSILAVVLLWASQLSKSAEVRKIQVTGNNEAAASVRRKIIESEKRYENQSCFSLVSKPLADGTMEINQAETSGGINALAVLVGSGSTTVVNAELSAKDGTVLWQDSKQGLPGIVSTGAKGGAERVLESLYKSSGCDKKGRRQ